ncbi:unnamed protein product [Brassica rapa]|uniref:Uncharacterized protein n=1 Tax=Brassica campestris TaxID=3711 RepID=A0A3P5Y1N6_BRACM|nr:unnamed protein product [Brassica rapa]VDC61302.1 unnamed protein product [Brassica rapa]
MGSVAEAFNLVSDLVFGSGYPPFPWLPCFGGACLRVRQSSSRLASTVAQVQIWEALLWVLCCGRVRGGLLSVWSTTTLVLGGVAR